MPSRTDAGIRTFWPSAGFSLWLRLPHSTLATSGSLNQGEFRFGQACSMPNLTSDPPRIDRYRAGLKGTWKDEPLPTAGQTYDLGVHLIDQALVLFGRPESLTAFKQNIRGVGHPDVDDSVRRGL